MNNIFAQKNNNVVIRGVVKDLATSLPVEYANIYVISKNLSAESNSKGEFEIKIPSEERLELTVRRLGFKEAKVSLSPKVAFTQLELNISLAPLESQFEVVISENRIDQGGMIRSEVESLKLLPTTSGNLESVLPSIALGTTSGTGGELSSQYQVRGGNYDENLVYVNDFEIYRPQLIRSGQQEGLSFPNIDLIRDLSFSSGGFLPQYGDKMSSVLDIRYKRPDSLKASAMASLLGASAHIEGSKSLSKDGYRKFRYLIGTRYKTTRYILSSLNVTGEYVPTFVDFQGYFTYDLNKNWQVGILANYNSSNYTFIPEERGNVASGLINFALTLRAKFEGQEIDDFKTNMAGVSFTYIPERKKNPLFLKFLASTFNSKEKESFDIIGKYVLGEIDVNLGSESAGDLINVLGSGVQHTFIRNTLQLNVTNFEHKGGIDIAVVNANPNIKQNHFIQWGAKMQNELIADKINEWERIDSALYSLPYDTTQLLLSSVLKTTNNLQSQRFSTFVQEAYSVTLKDRIELQLTGGVRVGYWTLNNELFVTPRLQLQAKPLSWKKDIVFRLSGGYYYQPPFYRELRNRLGEVNETALAQKSAQIVGGLTYDFLWGKHNPKKFRFITEAYYKQLWDLISYDVENVRIRYAGNNDSKGYITGIDFRINGEFVPNAESWINLSFLRARESINGVQHLVREIGDEEGTVVKDVPRPTDRLMSLSMFFQDYLPKNENLKMHLNLTVGTGLPYGLPNNNVIYRNTYRFNAYHRVDIGFSALLWNKSWIDRKPKHPLKFADNAVMSVEIYNLLKVLNVASNTWIKTVFNQQYAIPNYLSSRRINLKVRFDF